VPCVCVAIAGCFICPLLLQAIGIPAGMAIGYGKSGRSLIWQVTNCKERALFYRWNEQEVCEPSNVLHSLGIGPS
jgi:hypothetical protein